ncbi:hypothetical protein DM860_015485 [Cuscuta australis]|uniref:HMA domain-containing protein n=1 Tax=Cuscuta australis TaxID=267555 RepID=A0A328E7A2_9ASTE|nr:hypothetical protein DM860_015485 [Cuscuta australis]
MGLEQKKVVLPVKNMGNVENAQSKIMRTVTNTKTFNEVNYVAVEKDKVTITTFPNSNVRWTGVTIESNLGRSFGFELDSPTEEPTTYVVKNESTNSVVGGIQEVVLKVHCEEGQSETLKRSAMTNITSNGGVKFIAIADDSNKEGIVMRFRGQANVVVRSLLDLASGPLNIRFTVSSVSPFSKPKQPADKKEEEKKKDTAAKPDDKKSNKGPPFYNLEYNKRGRGDQSENVMSILAGIKGVHSISMEDEAKLLLITEAHETSNIRETMNIKKGLRGNFEFKTSKPMNNKPVEKKDQGNDDKKKIIVKSENMGMPDVRGRVMRNLGEVEGLDSILIEPAEKKLLTVTGSANVVDVLKALFKVKRLKDCTTIVSVGPNKKEEAKKKEGGGGGEKKPANPAPVQAAPPPPAPGMHYCPTQTYNNGYYNPPQHPHPYNQTFTNGYDAYHNYNYDDGCRIL